MVQGTANSMLAERHCICRGNLEGRREGSGGETDSGRVIVELGENSGGNKVGYEKSAKGGENVGRKVVVGRFHAVR